MSTKLYPLIGVLRLAAFNTIEGVGEDLSAAGNAIDHAVEDAKD